jgi:hypothetical protein
VTRRSGAVLSLAALAGLAALAVLASPALAQGCAMCKTALTNSPEGRAMATSFNRAILLMLAAPYVVFATGATIFFRRRLATGIRHAWTRLRPAQPEPQPAP